jgi:hypothetical protein
MLKRFIVFVVASGALVAAAAADYFPTAEGNVWTFSYVSESMPVVPNPPTTKDSGTVTWEIYSNIQTEELFGIGIKQTRRLLRRTLTQWGSLGYDSVFASPRTTTDTVLLIQSFQGSNEISFATNTCPFAVHDVTIAMPAGLSSKDTTASFLGTMSAGKKMIVSECSCLKNRYSYSFTLVPAIGPVGAYITMCPSMAGSSYQETWKLVGRGFPTFVLKGNAAAAKHTMVSYSQSSGRINCSLRLSYSSPVCIDVLDSYGRLIKRLFKGNLNAGEFRYSWNMPTIARGIALLRVRTGANERCAKILTGVKERFDK